MLQGQFISAADRNSRRIFVMLHGLGDSPAGWNWLPSALNLPWLNYYLVQAPDEYYGGYSWFEYPGDMAPGIHRSRNLLNKLLDQLSTQGFPSDQIILGGFSQGCLMSIETGLRYSRRLAGIVGISGWVFEIDQLLQDLTPVAKSQRLMVTHGHYDPILPFAEVQKQIRQLQSAGLSVAWHEYPKEHTIYGEEEINVIRDFVIRGFVITP